MKPNPGIPEDEDAKKAGLAEREIRTCSACGTKFPATTDSASCPVCILREAARGESATAEDPTSSSGSEHSSDESRPASLTRRFENYEVLLGENGQPIEAGHRGFSAASGEHYCILVHVGC